MPAALKFTLLVALAAVAQAGDIYVNLWKNPGCDPSAKSEDYISYTVPAAGTCQLGYENLGADWPKDDNGHYIVYVTGDKVPMDCTWTIRKAVDPDLKQCGEAIFSNTPGNRGTCRKVVITDKAGDSLCCGNAQQQDTCVLNYGGSGKRDIPVRTHAREMIVERAPEPLPEALPASADDTCTYHGTAPTIERGPAQELNPVDCPSGKSDCMVAVMGSRTTGSSNSFNVGTSVTAGGEFFVKLETSIHFDYTYTYMETQTIGVSATVPVPEGQKGTAVWTPEIQCTSGMWTGKCDWDTNKQGTACVPVHLNNDPKQDPKGTYSVILN